MITWSNLVYFSRKNPFTLLVALKDSENGGRGYTAKGDLFWDDGVSIGKYLCLLYLNIVIININKLSIFF